MRLKMISQNRINIRIIVTVFLLSLALITGCNEATDGNKDNDKSAKKSEKASSKESKIEKEEIAIVDKGKSAEEIDLVVYFAGEQGDELIRTIVKIEKTESVAKSAVEQLISGPTVSGSYRAIPAGTRLIGINIDGGVANVDLSKEFIDGHNGGSAEEMMSVYSIVNTLTEIPNIDAVIFLVEGKKIEAITGHLDLSEPVKRREDLIAT